MDVVHLIGHIFCNLSNTFSISSLSMAQISTCRVLLDVLVLLSLPWNTLCWQWRLMSSVACFVINRSLYEYHHLFQSISTSRSWLFYVSYTVHCNISIQYKPMRCTFPKLIFLIFNFLISSICFEPEGSSSGRQLCIQLRYGVFYVQKLQ